MILEKKFIKSSKNNGNRLNLEITTDIIIYHKIDKEIVNELLHIRQIIDRKKELNIYNLYYENEYNKENKENIKIYRNIIKWKKKKF